MADAAVKFKSAQTRLAKLNRTIDDLREEWLISMICSPLTLRQRELEEERGNVKAELQHLAGQLGVTMLGDVAA